MSETPIIPNPGETAAPAKQQSFATPFERWLTYILLMPLMALSTAFFGSMALLCAFWDKSGSQQHAIASIWGRSMLDIALAPVEVFGLEKLEGLGPAVYASNHLSYMDTPVLFGKLPFQFRILAKSGLWKVPFIGWYLNRSGQVPIDQKSSRTAIAGLLAGVNTLKSGMPILLFPEGGRTSDGSLKEMMSGCAFMAIRAGVPLVPLAIVGTYELLPMHIYHLAPRPLKLVIGDPIPTTGLATKDAETLTQRLFDEITTLYMSNHS